jgi:hypothetical protein
MVRVLLKSLGKNHKTFEDGSISNLPSTEKFTSSALNKYNNSDISDIYLGPPTATKGASEKMFSGHPTPARVDRQREKGNKAEIKQSALYTRLDCLITADTRETEKTRTQNSLAPFRTARPRYFVPASPPHHPSSRRH